MKFYIKILIIGLYSGFYSFAQTNINRTNGDFKNQTAYSVSNAKDNNALLIAGFTDGYGAIGKDILAYLVSHEGTGLLHKKLGGNGDEEIYSVITASDNHYVLVGYTNSQSKGGKDAFILKLDHTTLDVIWQKHFGDVGDDEFYEVIEHNDGSTLNYVAVGYTTQAGKGKEILYVETDANGNLVRYQTYGGTGDDVAKAIVNNTSSTQTTITGWTNSGSSYKNGLLISADTDGSLLNASAFNAGRECQFNQIDYRSDMGGLYVVGFVNSATLTKSGLLAKIKTDFTGVDFAKEFTNPNGDLEFLNFQSHTALEGLSIQGYALSNKLDKEGVLLATDWSGSPQNTTLFSSCLGDEVIYDGVKVSDQLFFTVGSTASYGDGANDLLYNSRKSFASTLQDCFQLNHTLANSSVTLTQSTLALTSLNSTLTLDNTSFTSIAVNQSNKSICDQPVASVVCGKTLNLGNDTAICVLPYTLVSGFKCAAHTWSTGSTDENLIVTKGGTYTLTVTDGTCTLRDTIKIRGGVSLATKQANIWHFGQNAGLDFNTSKASVLSNGIIDSREGSSSIADAAGNILFYTDGLTVRNKNHEIMVNGTGLLGDTSATQTALIIPHPGDKNLYYLFTTPAWDNPVNNSAVGFNYSLIDISKQGGLGEVVDKNIPLFTPCSEKLTAVRHANGIDIWVIAHESNSNRFKCYLITPKGLSTTVVTTAVGASYTSSLRNVGQLKASPSGQKLFVAVAAFGYQLLDFNSSTGIISNPITFNSFSLNNRPYGCEFSPDGTKIYLTDYNSSIIRQMDISSGNFNVINSTIFSITQTGNIKWGLQLAPDGKIYVVDNIGGNTLGVINNPNASGIAADYKPAAIILANGSKVYKSFPGFIQSYFKDKAPDFSYMDTCTTTETQFKLLNFADTTDLSWDFGDGQSSTAANTTHLYATGGAKTVQLTYGDACALSRSNSLSKTINIVEILPKLKDTIVCATPVSLDAGTHIAAKYTWSHGDTTQVTVVSDTGRYKVVVSLKGCNLMDSARVISGINTQIPDFTYKDTCYATFTHFSALNVPDSLGISWDFGDLSGSTLAQPSHLFASSGPKTVTLTYTDRCTQQKKTSKTINILAADTVALSSSKDTICFGERITFTASYSGSDPISKSWTLNNVLQSTDTGFVFTRSDLAVGIDSVVFRATPKGPVSCPTKLSSLKKIFVKGNQNISKLPINIDSNPICEGDTARFSTPSQGLAMLYWLVNGQVVDTTYEPYHIFKKADLPDSAIVKLRLSPQATCFDPKDLPPSDSILLRSFSVLKPVVSIITNTNPLCEGEKAIVKARSLHGGTQARYQWQINGLNVGNLTTDTTFESSSVRNGDTLSVILHSNYVCRTSDTAGSNNIAFSVQSVFEPRIHIRQNTPLICKGNGTIFNIDSIKGGGTTPVWEWKLNGANQGRQAVLILNQLKTGDQVSASLTSSSKCANPQTAVSNVLDITVFEKPAINLLDVLVYCDQEQSTLLIDPGQGSGYSYMWSTGDTTSTITVPTGKYKVKVTSAEGCVAEENTTVIISCEPKVYIPSAFTPNGDGKNDKLEFFSVFTTSFNIMFFNRWGEVIYNSDDQSLGWDGIYKGDTVPVGSYNYLCTYTGIFNGKTETKVIRGDVTVLE